MARINRISITLCALLFTTLPLTPMAHASKQARESSATTHITKKTQKTAKKAASKSTTKSKTASSVKKSSIT
ncbi:endopeptidase, partial [Escherichia coli]